MITRSPTRSVLTTATRRIGDGRRIGGAAPVDEWRSFTMTAGAFDTAFIGYTAAGSGFPAEIGSIDREPNEAHKLLALVTAENTTAVFVGDVANYLTTHALWVDGVPWMADSAEYNAGIGNTLAQYPSGLTFVDGQTYEITFGIPEGIQPYVTTILGPAAGEQDLMFTDSSLGGEGYTPPLLLYSINGGPYVYAETVELFPGFFFRAIPAALLTENDVLRIITAFPGGQKYALVPYGAVDKEVVEWTNGIGLYAPGNPALQKVPAYLPDQWTNLNGMLRYATSVEGPESWDTSNVTSMAATFEAMGTVPDVSGWDVSNVTDFSATFRSTTFNGDLSGWDMSSATTLYSMFEDSTFNNASISGWNTSSVTTMAYMFYGNSAFNQDISGWDTQNVVAGSGVQGMANMFRGASSFNQDLSGWCVSNIPTLPPNFATGSALAPEHYPVWGTCPL